MSPTLPDQAAACWKASMLPEARAENLASALDTAGITLSRLPALSADFNEAVRMLRRLTGSAGKDAAVLEVLRDDARAWLMGAVARGTAQIDMDNRRALDAKLAAHKEKQAARADYNHLADPADIEPEGENERGDA